MKRIHPSPSGEAIKTYNYLVGIHRELKKEYEETIPNSDSDIIKYLWKIKEN
jgi:hypothetical protein